MDILIHTLSGVAAGTVVSSFSSKGFLSRLGIVSIGGLGGILPDFDAISLWSGFDSTIGKFFSLTNNGEEIYFSKFWYSHHGFLHSITASLIIGVIIGLTIYFMKSRFKKLSIIDFLNNFNTWKLILISFVAGFIIHLLEDMPTPSYVWGGVNFFWPSKAYIGGSGDIWWWNNYDIFLIVVGVILINLIILPLERLLKVDLRKITLVVFLIGSILSIIQIKTRGFDFNYTRHSPKFQEYEIKSKEIQEQILGKKLFLIMEKFDNKLKLNF